MNRRLGEDVAWGARLGLVMGLVYAAIGGLLYLAQDSPEIGRIRLPSLLALYVFGGVTGGVIVGVLRPILNSHLGAIFAGTVSLLPFGFATIVLYSGPISEWGLAEYIGILVTALILGGYIGHDLWKDERASLSRRPESEESLKPGRRRNRRERRRNSI